MLSDAGSYVCSTTVDGLMAVTDPELIALHRSTAMLQPNVKASVDREQLLELIDELVATRRLLTRLGGDLRTVARRASNPSD